MNNKKLLTTSQHDTPSLLKEEQETGAVVTATEPECVVSPVQFPSQPIAVHQPDSTIPDSPTTIPETQLG